ncbi:MAG: hypothetical protein OQL08_05045 [Gammaproteobacteria bacterium]|nr:hypothetical protein [Gammaproteobacteria bacterium]
MKTLRLLTLPALVFLLAACSPHPGAGNWQESGEAEPQFITEFTRLEVSYEGRTDIFNQERAQRAAAGETNGAIRRCFWHGVDAQTIALSCVQADDTDIEESYQLRVDGDNTTAELIQGETVVGRFVRDLPTAR